ncbi:MAG: dihydrolipoyllysine-residue acetyltransferase [Burkholderiaceae bacterium]|jgi:pyruvate dehydrogenase E2 component (dihydrolipoamide acetyltransferase)
MSVIEMRVPDIGDFKDVEVIEVLIKPGESVKAEQSLITVESDKASMEIPSSTAGTVTEVKVKLGDKVSEGSLLGLLETAGEAAQAPKAPAAASPKAAAEAPPKADSPSAKTAANAPATRAPSAGSSGPVEAKVPDIGDFKDVEVIEILVKVGDTVALDQSLITVESDKASMEIPSSAAGQVKELRVKLGDKVSKGSVVALLEASTQSAPPAANDALASAPEPAKDATASKESASVRANTREHPVPADERETAAGPLPHASPSVRKLARELGVDLTRVTASGPKGRILAEDVQGFVKAVMAQAGSGKAPAVTVREGMVPMELLPWPSLEFSKFGATELLPLSRIKKISGPNLARNWAMIPHVTQFDEADVTDLESFRKSTNEALAKEGVKVTMLAFVMKACVAALKAFPNFNSSLDAEQSNLILKKYYNLGFAADTPNGLVVPVLKDCDQKGISAIAGETSALAKKARDGKLGPAEMQGASFTISSLGGVGGTAFTPIINAPEVAILGLSKSEIKPKWDGKQFAPRLMLPLSLSYDHRVIDGAQAARFTTYLVEVLADLRRVLL